MCLHGLPYMGKATRHSCLCGLEQEDSSPPTLEFLTNLEELCVLTDGHPRLQMSSTLSFLHPEQLLLDTPQVVQ